MWLQAEALAVALTVPALLLCGLLIQYVVFRHQWVKSNASARGPPSLMAWLVAHVQLPEGKKGELGAVNIVGLITMGIAMIFIAVGFIMFPVVMTGTDAVLAYEYTSNTSITDASFTGLTAVIGILPLVTLLGFVFAGVITGFLGFKMQRSGGGSLSPGNLMLLGLSMVFIAIGVIIYPVTLDGIASVLHGGGDGISSSYTGLAAILGVVPLIIITAFMAAGIVSGFFGVKGLAASN